MTNSIGIITNKVQPKVLGSEHFLYHDTGMTMVILECIKQKKINRMLPVQLVSTMSVVHYSTAQTYSNFASRAKRLT
jgi:hypothetical protein